MNNLIAVLRRRPARTIGVLVVGLLVALVAWNLLMPLSDPRVKAIRARGYPVTLAELDAWYPAVSPADNAALTYTEAFALQDFSDSSQLATKLSLDLPPRGQKLTGEAKTNLAALLEKCRPALDLFHSVPPSARSRYPIDLKMGALTLLPHLGKSKAAVNLLCDEALFDSADGQPDKATQAFEAAAGVPNSLSQEPMLISYLVGMADWSIIVSRLERLLNETPLADAQLAQLQKLTALAERPKTFARVLAGERAFGLAFFTDPAAPRQLLPSSGSGTGSTGANLGLTASFGLLKATGLLQKDKAFFLDSMAANIAAAELDYPQRFKLGQQAATLTANPPNRLCIFSRMLLPGLSKAFNRDAEHVARLRVAQTALAIERFRLAHGGALPSQLDQLVPACLDRPLPDPIDGQPLRFKRTDRGYVVYSIGTDEHDDGGSERDPKHFSNPHDITFVVETPARGN